MSELTIEGIKKRWCIVEKDTEMTAQEFLDHIARICRENRADLACPVIAQVKI